MTLNTILEQLNAGSCVAILVVITLLIQISPLKLDPWTWLGDQLNKNIKHDFDGRIDDVEQQIGEMNLRITDLNGKLNAHMVESYRSEILHYADSVMSGKTYTIDKWRQMLKVCALYEEFIRDNGLINGDATEGIEYIRETYHSLCQTGSFVGFPTKGRT